MLTYPKIVSVNPSLHDFIKVLWDLDHGELREVEIEEDVTDDSGQNLSIAIDRPTEELVNTIKSGTTYFRLIRVHQKQPVYAEIPYVSKCRKYTGIRYLKF
jgi:hypothetical protein